MWCFSPIPKDYLDEEEYSQDIEFLEILYEELSKLHCCGNTAEACDRILEIVKQKIKNNTKFLDEINQYLHNKGIEIVKRYEIVTNILLCKDATTLTDDETIDWVNQKLSTVSIDKNEIFQIVFMFSKMVKTSYFQFSTLTKFPLISTCVKMFATLKAVQ